MTPKEILALCKEKDVKAIDFRFMDFPGLWQHTTIPANQLDEDTFTDNGGEIIPRRIRTTPYINTTKAGPSLKSMYIGRLELDVENSVADQEGQGENPRMMLRVSLDGGHTFGNVMYRDMGKAGETFKRILYNRLGTSRRPVFELSVTDPVKTIILGAWVEMSAGKE